MEMRYASNHLVENGPYFLVRSNSASSIHSLLLARALCDSDDFHTCGRNVHIIAESAFQLRRQIGFYMPKLQDLLISVQAPRFLGTSFHISILKVWVFTYY